MKVFDEAHVTSDGQLLSVTTNAPAAVAVATTAEKPPKPNPYIEALARELLFDMLPSSGTTPQKLAQRIYTDLVVPKNERIHDMSGDIQRLEAQIKRLERVLDRHNEGVWNKGKETAVDCVIRMLSPVRDDTPKRDRP
jgi:hypothetical protein